MDNVHRSILKGFCCCLRALFPSVAEQLTEAEPMACPDYPTNKISVVAVQGTRSSTYFPAFIINFEIILLCIYTGKHTHMFLLFWNTQRHVEVLQII